MRTHISHISKLSQPSLKHRIFGSKVKRNIKKSLKDSSLLIKEQSTDFFEDIPLYRGNRIRALGKTHRARSRRNHEAVKIKN